jgi:hypothetical protein
MAESLEGSRSHEFRPPANRLASDALVFGTTHQPAGTESSVAVRRPGSRRLSGLFELRGFESGFCMQRAWKIRIVVEQQQYLDCFGEVRFVAFPSLTDISASTHFTTTASRSNWLIAVLDFYDEEGDLDEAKEKPCGYWQNDREVTVR